MKIPDYLTSHPARPLAQSVIDAIGNTPLIKLQKASAQTGCTILGKAEFMNPGGSIKDRAARQIVLDAEARGLLKPGATLIEGTAGNTGIGLAMVARARGYRCRILIPETQSKEKKDAIRLYGAELIEVPALPYRDPNNYVKQAGRLAEAMNAAEPGSAFWAQQFDNLANREAHRLTTAPEILRDLDGKLDGFICAVGSGGTLAGVAAGFAEAGARAEIGLVDPMGAALYAYYTRGELAASGSSISEGIGQGRITANLEGLSVDRAFQVADADWLPILFDLLAEEGLALGGSAAVNVLGAIKMAEALGPGKTIVTILCDSLSRYASQLLNPDFLTAKGLPLPDWMAGS